MTWRVEYWQTSPAFRTIIERGETVVQARTLRGALKRAREAAPAGERISFAVQAMRS